MLCCYCGVVFVIHVWLVVVLMRAVVGVVVHNYILPWSVQFHYLGPVSVTITLQLHNMCLTPQCLFITSEHHHTNYFHHTTDSTPSVPLSITTVSATTRASIITKIVTMPRLPRHQAVHTS